MSHRIQQLGTYSTFGDLLKYLRTRAQLTQRDLSIAVGYSEAQISRLECNRRAPNEDALLALFVPALGLEDNPEILTQLLALARKVREPDRSAMAAGYGQDHPAPGAHRKHHNLPVELTSLVGRDADLAEIARLLDLPTTRLLTLTGAGGCGKSRLALRTGHNLAKHFRQGA